MSELIESRDVVDTTDTLTNAGVLESDLVVGGAFCDLFDAF